MPPRIVILACLATIASTQSGGTEAWSEADVYWHFNPRVRLVFLASASDRRDVTYSDVETGVNLDFFVPRFRPILFRRLVETDDARMQRIVLRIGYHVSRSINHEPPTIEHRPLVEATLRWAFPYAILLSDRNRAEFRIISGDYSWRYRNELKLERDFKIRRYAFTGYISAEGFFDSRTDSISRHRYTLGSVLPAGRRFDLEPYFTHQIDLGDQPRHATAIGFTLNVYLEN